VPEAPGSTAKPTETDRPAHAANSPSSGSLEKSPGSELITEDGRTTIQDSVVSKIAGVAAREVNGVHAMGGGAAGRAIGAIRDKLGTSSGASQGVSVEVGERQAAIDLDVIVEYGVSVPDLADGVRKNVKSRVEGMLGLEVVEVNIAINDVYLGGSDDEEESRVE